MYHQAHPLECHSSCPCVSVLFLCSDFSADSFLFFFCRVLHQRSIQFLFHQIFFFVLFVMNKYENGYENDGDDSNATTTNDCDTYFYLEISKQTSKQTKIVIAKCVHCVYIYSTSIHNKRNIKLNKNKKKANPRKSMRKTKGIENAKQKEKAFFYRISVLVVCCYYCTVLFRTPIGLFIIFMFELTKWIQTSKQTHLYIRKQTFIVASNKPFAQGK